ncbi:hypothetical protein EJ05DRAFT_512854 [Pseudovirgaria hyperparasitica]|uniref:tRNA(Phe) (4-demethylwyosine(37)-C(7)) aminocarboxypropyltransferase n=1 Tax=Pseudovirgaria hyperparasitica TaxID=470096 RepID=A0A6A6VZP8_9PEZI|nr:uncharacterized protein EJ05DRAFT_512854 [Pseudovirgaria hyperparasitica]KAF2755326.1 hypothetical protein EJ05DRAFT_512854 [Pseudovirgaria hyperparasitica]
MSERVIVIVPRLCVKTVKSYLESQNLLDKSSRIQSCGADDDDFIERSFEIPTLIDCPTRSEQGRGVAMHDRTQGVLNTLCLRPEDKSRIKIKWAPVVEAIDEHQHAAPISLKNNNPILTAQIKWMNSLQPDLLAQMKLDSSISIDSPTPYCIYKPLLLLSADPLKRPSWQTAYTVLSPTQLSQLWALMALETNTTHVAINAPIPVQTSTSVETNILRSPTAFTPLHGSFGPAAPIPSPTLSDFASAFWVSTKQNGIHQIWAPLHTMFSRGNIKEKARLLKLPSVVSCSESGAEWTAVDLYCGIGYFSFSYSQAGATVVLGWEINGWSLEGMRRGVEANKWRGEVVREDEHTSKLVRAFAIQPKAKLKPLLVAFHESNALAMSRIKDLRACIPPIRHVNLGLLPSSAASCETAVNALDIELSGWLHVHENIATKKTEYDDRIKQIVNEIGAIVRSTASPDRVVRLEHVEHVKTYAPGVMHCVLDVCVEVADKNMSRLGEWRHVDSKVTER